MRMRSPFLLKYFNSYLDPVGTTDSMGTIHVYIDYTQSIILVYLLVVLNVHDTVRLYSQQLCATGVSDSCASVVELLAC